MAQIEFSRAGHMAISKEIGEELKALGLRLGVNFQVGGGNIAVDNLIIKITARSSDPVQAERGARAKFAQHASWYGLEAGDYEAEFTNNGRRYKLLEFAPSRPKYPLIGADVRTGKRFKFTTSVVAQIKANRAMVAAVDQAAAVVASSKAASDILASVAQF